MNRNARLIIVVGCVPCLLGFFSYLVRSVAVPFLLGLILAYFLDPAVDLLETRRIPRTPAIDLVFAGLLLAVPMAASGKVLGGRLVRRYRESALYSQACDGVCHAEDS